MRSLKAIRLYLYREVLVMETGDYPIAPPLYDKRK